jgi:hypothetical protein
MLESKIEIEIVEGDFRACIAKTGHFLLSSFSIVSGVQTVEMRSFVSHHAGAAIAVVEVVSKLHHATCAGIFTTL